MWYVSGPGIYCKLQGLMRWCVVGQTANMAEKGMTASAMVLSILGRFVLSATALLLTKSFHLTTLLNLSVDFFRTRYTDWLAYRLRRLGEGRRSDHDSVRRRRTPQRTRWRHGRSWAADHVAWSLLLSDQWTVDMSAMSSHRMSNSFRRQR